MLVEHLGQVVNVHGIGVELADDHFGVRGRGLVVILVAFMPGFESFGKLGTTNEIRSDEGDMQFAGSSVIGMVLEAWHRLGSVHRMTRFSEKDAQTELM